MKNHILLSFLIVGLVTFSVSAQSDEGYYDDSQKASISFEFNDFPCSGPTESDDWTYSADFNTQKCGKDTYLGLYKSKASIQRNFTDLALHNSVYIVFNVAAVDGWDDGKIQIIVDNAVVGEQTYDSNSNRAKEVCKGKEKDVLATQSARFDHSADDLSLTIRPLFSKTTKATWGICDLEIHFNPCKVGLLFDKVKDDCQKTCSSGLYTDFSSGICSDCDEENCITTSKKDFSCKSPEKSDKWVYSPDFQTTAVGRRKFVGGFAAQEGMASYYTILSPHKSIKLSFLLHLFGQWDQNLLQVASDRKPVYEKAFNSTDKNQMVSFEFNHESESLQLTLQSDVKNGTWGICDLEILVQNCTVAEGVCLNEEDLGSKLYTAFDCANIKDEAKWEYSKGYQNITCANYELLGGYSTGKISRLLPKLEEHQSVYVRVALALFDQWNEGDAVIFKADGETVYRKNATQAASNQTCNNHVIDFFGEVAFEFPHKESKLLFEVSSTLESDAGSWAICGLKIRFNTCPIGKFFSKGKCVDSCPEDTRLLTEARSCIPLPGEEPEVPELPEEQPETKPTPGKKPKKGKKKPSKGKKSDKDRAPSDNKPDSTPAAEPETPDQVIIIIPIDALFPDYSGGGDTYANFIILGSPNSEAVNPIPQKHLTSAPLLTGSEGVKEADPCIQASLIEGKNGEAGSVSIRYGSKSYVISQSTPSTLMKGPKNEKIHVTFSGNVANIRVDDGKGYVDYSKNLHEDLPKSSQGRFMMNQDGEYVRTGDQTREKCVKQAMGGLRQSNGGFVVRKSLEGDTNVLGGLFNLKMGGLYQKAGGVDLDVGSSQSVLNLGGSCGC